MSGSVPAQEAPRRLEAREVHVAFRGVVALNEVTAELAQGEILGLIGPNGAGKTTLINVVSGFVSPDRGEVMLDGRPITRLAVHRRPGRGLARTFQSVRLFARLSVSENVEGAVLAAGLRGRRARERVQQLVERMGLGDHAQKAASQLSHGTERRVGIARALATEPAFLLLDEPAAGLDDSETVELSRLLLELRAELGIGMMVVEHDMSLVMSVCDRIQVLVEGRTVALGEPGQIRSDPEVRRAYLGSEEELTVAGS